MNFKKSYTYLSFDYGTVFIGIAIGQTLTKTAKPLTTLKIKNNMIPWDHIKNLISLWKPDALIIGMPIDMHGKKQEIFNKAQVFAAELKKHVDIPIYFADERLTTVEARQKLFEQGGYRALKKTDIDAMAAVLILESWMREKGDY